MRDDDDAGDLTRWLSGTADPPTGPTGAPDDRAVPWPPARVALVLLVLAPWAVFAVLALAGADDPSAPAATMDPSAPVADAPSVVPTGASRAGRPAAARPPDGDTGDLPPGVGPTAVRVVRDAVTRAGATSTALDAAAVEAIEPLGADMWAVRVHAVVLRGDRRRWATATHEVWAAPVGRRGGGIVGLDRPWRVATLDAPVTPTSWDAADVDRRAVAAALDAAGIGHGRALRVERHPRVPGIVRAVVGDGRPVWVRLEPAPTVVGHHAGTASP